MAKKTAQRSARKTTKRTATKREHLSPRGDARFVRRDAGGRIKESDDLGRAMNSDRPKKAKTKVRSGQGDRGDQKRRSR